MSEQNRIDGIQLLAKQAVEGFIIGLHKSPFHGFSVEFSEHRIYNRGDNLKHIDWKVYGKSDKLFVKKYEEETNLRCHILIDVSGSMHFPKNPKYYNKLQFSAIAAAAIAEVLKGQQDACGITLFDDRITYHSACKSSGMHYNNLMVELNALLNAPIPKGSLTRTADIIHEIAEKIHRRSLVIIFSDMIDRYSETEEIIQAIQHLKHNKHEVLVFQVMDKAKEVELELSNKPYKFVDLETGESIKMNNLQIKDYYVTQMRSLRKELDVRLGQMSIDLVDADINQSFDQILTAYFLKRNKMM